MNYLKISHFRKKILVFAIILIMFLMLFLIPLPVNAKVDTTITCTSASDMALMTYKNYNNGTRKLPTSIKGCINYTLDIFFLNKDFKGPIGIVKGVLHNNNCDTDVYIITLSGTELIYDNKTGIQSSGAITDLMQGFNMDNPYSYAVVNAILKNIPKNANLLFYGHSLGGMVAQHVISKNIIKRNYNVINCVTYGSPLIRYFNFREGQVSRLCDYNDIIPACSVYTLTPFWVLQFLSYERKVECANYPCYELLDSHITSYIRNDIWGKYDVLGNKYQNARLTFDILKTKSYPAPFFC